MKIQRKIQNNGNEMRKSQEHLKDKEGYLGKCVKQVK